MTEPSYGCWPIVPCSLPSCLPQLRSHAGTLSRPSRREYTQKNNCSDRRALVCSNIAATGREGRQAVREAGGSGRRTEGGYDEQETGPCTLGPLHISRQACVLCGSQQRRTVRHVSGPSRHKQMFSGYCCSTSIVIVFLQGQPVGQGARLCCGKELWRWRELFSSSSGFGGCCTQAVWLFPYAPFGLNNSNTNGEGESIS